MENKSNIVQRLHLCLLATRAGEDVADMQYFKFDDGVEWVTIIFKDGSSRPVNVTADSGIAMIQDVVKALY